VGTVTDPTAAALLSILRSIHQGVEAAMHLLMEPPAPAQPEKPKRRYMGDTEAPPCAALTLPENET
jgi:hypothetical protein